MNKMKVEVWMNKTNAEIALFSPRWEPLTCDYDENLFKELDPMVAEMVGDRKIARGTLIQVGWLMENGQGVWFGLPLSIVDQFEVLGEA